MDTNIPSFDAEKHEADRQLFASEMHERRERDLKILAQVQAQVPVKAFQQIQEKLSSSGHTHSYQIVGQPAGKPQNDGFVLGKVFVDQIFHGGPSGDDSAGTMCMPLREGKYFSLITQIDHEPLPFWSIARKG